MKEIDIINAKINKKGIDIPQFLYKYRPFDEFTYDMLQHQYVFLSPAEKLDDPSECRVDFSVQDIFDLKTNQLTFKGIDMLLAFIKPYTSQDNFQQVKKIVYGSLTPEGLGRGPDLLEAYFDMQGLAPDATLVPLINQLRSIPEKLNDSTVRKDFEKLFLLAYDARRDMGICSLSELSNSDEMWRNYADDSQGYCVEYYMRDYVNTDALFPVVYQDNRETNIVTNILGSFIGEMVFGVSNGAIATDKSQFIRMFLTKDLKWSYQKEWRLLGDAKQKLKAPTISRIYLGSNVSKKDKITMSSFCQKNNIALESVK